MKALFILLLVAAVCGVIYVAMNNHRPGDSTTAVRPPPKAPAAAPEPTDDAPAPRSIFDMPSGSPSRTPVAPAPAPIIQPPRPPVTPTPDVSVANQVGEARAKLRIDVGRLHDVEAKALVGIESSAQFKSVASDRAAASQAARDGDADGARKLAAAIQAMSDLRRAGLAKTPEVLAIRASVQADENALAALLAEQGISVVASPEDARAAGAKEQYIRGYYAKDGTYVPGHMRHK